MNQGISDEFVKAKARSGAPSIAQAVQALGFRCSARTVGPRMSKLGLRVRYAKKFRHTTDSKHRLPVAPNILDRQFQVSRPNQEWVGDITYLRTREGWLYLAVMLDLYSRLVVGWQISERIDRQLVTMPCKRPYSQGAALKAF